MVRDKTKVHHLGAKIHILLMPASGPQQYNAFTVLFCHSF